MAVILNGHSFKSFVALYAEDFYALQYLTTRKAESVKVKSFPSTS
jgi:hypothetical protein